jgi:16S rRNA processing protein RimM
MSDTKRTEQENQIKDQGSPQPGEPVFILVGKIRRPHGVDGEIMIDAYSESPERFKPGRKVFLGEDHQPHVIRSRRTMNKAMLITLKDVDSTEQAGLYRNKFIYILKEDLPELPEGEYYHFDLIGLQVYDPSDKFLGKLVEVIETGANDVYVVTNEQGEEILIPAISQVVVSVSIPDGKMVVNPPEWI